MYKRTPTTRSEKYQAMEKTRQELEAKQIDYIPPTVLIPEDDICDNCPAKIQIKIDGAEIVSQLMQGIASDNDGARLKEIGLNGLRSEINSEFTDNLDNLMKAFRQKAIDLYLAELSRQVFMGQD